MTKIHKLAYLLLLGQFFIPQAQAEWVDLSPSVEITTSRQALDRVKRVLFSYVTITNTSTEALPSATRLVISNPSIPTLNSDGTTGDDESYILVSGGIEAGASTKVRVDFQLKRARLSFTPKLMKDVVAADLQLLSHEFVELRGREGHQGLFPLFSAPTAGDAKVHTFTNNAVKELSITVVTDFGNSQFVVALNDSLAEGEKEAYTDIVLPSTPFKLRFKMESEQGWIVTTESDVITPQTFSLSLALVDGHTFTIGENYAALSITNHSNFDTSYEVIINEAVEKPINSSSTKSLCRFFNFQHYAQLFI